MSEHCESCSHPKPEKDAKRILRSLISGALLVLGFLIPAANYNWLKILVWIVSYLIVSADVLKGAAKGLAHKRMMDENFLMSVASLGAFAIGEYPEGIAVMIFFQLGEYFQEKALAKSKKSIADLMDLKPSWANLKKGNKTIKVKPQALKVGDEIEIRVGEKVPVDGVILKGGTTLDTRALTGESLPREAGVGEIILSGCINVSGLITVRTTKTYTDSTANKIRELVEHASDKKSQAERFITRFAKIYTPMVIGLALLIILIFPFLGGWSGANFILWLNRALVFLVVACPCALVISVPLSFVGGLGNLARQGVLVKGTTYLENLTKVSTVVFDKTGTLTKGEFAIEKLVNKSKMSDEKLLEMVMTLESFSNHPLATSLVKNYQNRSSLPKNKVSDFWEAAGKGVMGNWEGKKVIIGNQKLITRMGGRIKDKSRNGTVIWIMSEGQDLGYLVLADQLKEEAAETIMELQKTEKVAVVMLTGDNQNMAKEAAQKAGIKKYYAELLPDEKMKKVDRLVDEQESSSGKVAVIGDGINDAPVLMRADIGIAMGGIGSDAAIEAADIVIMNDELQRIPTMFSIAKKTATIAQQNIIFALVIKVLVMSLSMMGTMSMWVAVFADVGVTLLAIMNAMRAAKVDR